MYRIQCSHHSTTSCYMAVCLAIVLLFFGAGCVEIAAPTIETSPTASMDMPLTPQETARFTPAPSSETKATALAKTSPTPQASNTFTATPGAQMTESAPHVSPYVRVIVEDVEIRYLETSPVQVELIIRGALPDACPYSFYSIENRGGQNIKVTLDGIHPADSCQQVSQSIEYVLLLGRDMPEPERGFAPGDYTLTVNNYQTTFSIQE